MFAETHSARYLHGLFCPRSESWLNPAAANSASTLSRGQGWTPGHSSDLVRSRQISSAKALALDWQNGPPTCALRSGRRRPRLRPLALLMTPFSTQKIAWKHRDHTSAETSKFEFGPWLQLMMRPKACVWLFSASISSPEQEVKICPEFGFVLNPCAFSALDGFAKDVLCRNFEHIATRSGNNSSPSKHGRSSLSRPLPCVARPLQRLSVVSWVCVGWSLRLSCCRVPSLAAPWRSLQLTPLWCWRQPMQQVESV